MKNEDRLIEQSYLLVVVGECVMPFTDLITDGPAKRGWFNIVSQPVQLFCY